MKIRSGFLILLFSIVLFPVLVFASTWAKSYGGSSFEEAYSIQETPDGSFIVAGITSSYGAGDTDALVFKLDADGNVIWQKAYGGSSGDYARSIQETSDGGFIVAGYTRYPGDLDALVFKLDADGNVIWQKAYGGSSSDYAMSIQETSDGGFIVAGQSRSFGSVKSDFWVLKLDANGNVIWQKTYGGSNSDFARSVQETSDGGFIVAGGTNSYGAGSQHSWVLKLDANGNVIWQKTYSGSEEDYSEANSVQETSDGGFIVAGQIYPFAGSDYTDYWVLKLDADGNVIWQKAYGDGGLNNGQHASSIQETSDGSFIVAGYMRYRFSDSRVSWVLKLDSIGNVIWQKTYGGSSSDYYANSIQETSDGGFIFAGNVYGSLGSDSWVVKLDSNGNVPGCDLIQNTSVVPVNINYIPGISDSIPVNTNSTVTNTTLGSINTDLYVEGLCPYLLIMITSPNGGEELHADDTFEITWTSEGNIENVKIDYSANNGADWTEIIDSTGNDGSYNWNVPCDPSGESLIRISDVDSEVSDESDEVFSIVCVEDTDGDGIPNDQDACPFSDLTETVVIDGWDSGVENALLEDGCTISDLIAECADEADNHGGFVSAVSHTTNALKKEGIISGKDKGRIQKGAAKAAIP